MTKAVDIKRDQFWNKSFISVPSLKSLIGKNLTYNENVAFKKNLLTEYSVQQQVIFCLDRGLYYFFGHLNI